MNRVMNSAGLALALFLASGCTTLYQFSAEGSVMTTAEEPAEAVLVWDREQGRTWYGAKYDQLSSDVQLRICQVGAIDFGLKDGEFTWMAEGARTVVLELADDGSLRAASPGSDGDGMTKETRCGLLLENGSMAGVEDLTAGKRLSVALVCESPSLQEGKYVFSATSKIEAPDDGSRPSPCRAEE